MSHNLTSCTYWDIGTVVSESFSMCLESELVLIFYRYAIERLVRRYIVQYGIDVTIYYYQKISPLRARDDSRGTRFSILPCEIGISRIGTIYIDVGGLRFLGESRKQHDDTENREVEVNIEGGRSNLASDESDDEFGLRSKKANSKKSKTDTGRELQPLRKKRKRAWDELEEELYRS